MSGDDLHIFGRDILGEHETHESMPEIVDADGVRQSSFFQHLFKMPHDISGSERRLLGSTKNKIRLDRLFGFVVYQDCMGKVWQNNRSAGFFTLGFTNNQTLTPNGLKGLFDIDHIIVQVNAVPGQGEQLTPANPVARATT